LLAVQQGVAAQLCEDGVELVLVEGAPEALRGERGERGRGAR